MSSVIQTTNDEHLNIMYVLQTQVLYTNQQKEDIGMILTYDKDIPSPRF
jgi:hypothetical protein